MGGNIDAFLVRGRKPGLLTWGIRRETDAVKNLGGTGSQKGHHPWC